MSDELEQNGISKKKIDGCACFSTSASSIYILPVFLEIDILPYVEHMAPTSLSFEKTSLLKIQTKIFSITGIKKLKEIRFTLKDTTRTDLTQIFEESIIKYVKFCKERPAQ